MNKFKTSKRLSYILRHAPESAKIVLSSDGYAPTSDVCNYLGVTLQQLENIVETNNKKRFTFNHDKTSIKACQGHSVKIDLKLESVPPPSVLYHGTTTKFLNSIENDGIQKMNRHHVHLSEDKETATAVGKRHGIPVVLIISAIKMFNDGAMFYKTDNGVWLTDNVPYKYVKKLALE